MVSTQYDFLKDTHARSTSTFILQANYSFIIFVVEHSAVILKKRTNYVYELFKMS